MSTTKTTVPVASLDPVSIRLLDALQLAVPLVDRPFRALGENAGISEREAIERIAMLRGRVIRQISAIFDSRSLGYQSCLVGAKVDESHIEQAAAIIGQHPGVSHNYRRNHAFNLWYTLAVPPDSRFGLERTAGILQQLSGAESMRLLPAIKLYKIGVKFDLGGESATPARLESAQTPEPSGESRGGPSALLTARDKRIVRVLQQDLPLIAEPFDLWAHQAGVSKRELIDAAQSYIDAGIMRRFSAVLRHRAAGFGANAMGCWIVPPDQHDRFGQLAAGFAAVSHCYRRPTYPDWPYSIFTMVHATKAAECEAVLSAIAQAADQRLGGAHEFASLYSTHEFKKVRVKYFTDDIARWERQHDEELSATSRSACHAG